jgi:hypothetical protein
MEKNERILGRRLAVEETRVVSGAQRAVTTIVDFNDQETSPLNDQTLVTSDSGTLSDSGTTADSGTVADTGTFADSGTVDDTGVLMDCIGSGTTREVCLSPDP